MVHLGEEVGVPPPVDEGGARVVGVGGRRGIDDGYGDPRERFRVDKAPAHAVLVPSVTQLSSRVSEIGRRPLARAARVHRVPRGHRPRVARRVAGEVLEHELRGGQLLRRLVGRGPRLSALSRGVDVFARDEVLQGLVEMSIGMRRERHPINLVVSSLRPRRHVYDELADARSDADAGVRVAQRHGGREQLLDGGFTALVHVHQTSRIRNADGEHDASPPLGRIEVDSSANAVVCRGDPAARRREIHRVGETRRTNAAQSKFEHVKVGEEGDGVVIDREGGGGNPPRAGGIEELHGSEEVRPQLEHAPPSGDVALLALPFQHVSDVRSHDG